MSRTSIVLGRTAGGFTTAIVQATLVLLLSIPLGFRPNNLLSLPLTAALLVLIAITFAGFGIVFASQFPDSEGFSLTVQFIVFPLFFLSGVLYPLEGLPEPVQYLALLNPLTYGVDGLWGRWWGPGPRRTPSS